jgi:hypothetical protein
MNKLRQKSWYYAALLTSVSIVLAFLVAWVALVLDGANELMSVKIEARNYIFWITIITGAAGSFVFNWIPAKVKTRLRWLMAQPLAGQAAIWLLLSLLLLSAAELIRINVLTVWTASLDISMNVVFSLFGMLILYRFVDVLFKSNK